IAALDTKISTVLDRANKESMNLYAECMCKRLGHEISGESGSWANGTAAVGAFLTRIGVPEAHFHLDDGCGLSRENNVTADAIVKILAYNFRGPNREVFLNSLAVPGEEGTFKKRFAGSLRGRVFGKSGYVNNVSAVSRIGIGLTGGSTQLPTSAASANSNCAQPDRDRADRPAAIALAHHLRIQDEQHAGDEPHDQPQRDKVRPVQPHPVEIAKHHGHHQPEQRADDPEQSRRADRQVQRALRVMEGGES